MGKQKQAQILSDASRRFATGCGVARSSLSDLTDRFIADERGSTAVEYSIIAVIVSIAAVGALAIIGPSVIGMFSDAGAPF
jgi:Flp pilus assembly pilin Flp